MLVLFAVLTLIVLFRFMLLGNRFLGCCYNCMAVDLLLISCCRRIVCLWLLMLVLCGWVVYCVFGVWVDWFLVLIFVICGGFLGLFVGAGFGLLIAVVGLNLLFAC